MKRAFLWMSFFLAIAVFSTVYAQESLTLTTYYPSPFGVYDRLRLVPRLPAGLNCVGLNDWGTIYYDSTLETLRICEDDSSGGGQWSSLGGSDIWRRDAADERVFLQNQNDVVGIGTAIPTSKLQVVGGYLQIPTTTNPPPNADCNDPQEAGRIILQTDTNELYLCTQPSPDLTIANPSKDCGMGSRVIYPDGPSATQFCKENVGLLSTHISFSTTGGILMSRCQWTGVIWQNQTGITDTTSVICSQPGGWVSK